MIVVYFNLFNFNARNDFVDQLCLCRIVHCSLLFVTIDPANQTILPPSNESTHLQTYILLQI